MTSDGDLYLPDLAKVFAGEAVVFSWDKTFQSLRQPNSRTIEATVADILGLSSKIRAVISQTVPLFPQRSPQSKASYETKTAAINVTPSSESSYDIAQIKKDTLWLSAEVKIAEDEALRITILEWLQRPRHWLTAGFSEVEQASLRDALGPQTAVTGDWFNHLFPLRLDNQFEGDLERRRRILVTYAREQAGVLGVTRELQYISMLQNAVLDWQHALKDLALGVHAPRTADPGFKAFLDNIDARLNTIHTGRMWKSDDEPIEDLWLISEHQMMHQILELLLLRLRSTPQASVHSDVIVQWFHTAGESQFFTSIQSNVQVPADLVQRLQAIASIVSVALLDPASAVATLSSTTTFSNPDVYYLNPSIVLDLTQTLTDASESCVPQAGPASLAWALILAEIRNSAAAAKESRERNDDQRSSDVVSHSEQPSSRRVSYGSLQQSVYEDIVDQVMGATTVSDAIAYLLRCSTEVNHAFDILASLAIIQHEAHDISSAVKLQVLQEVVTVSVSVLGYNPEVLETQFAVLATHVPVDRSENIPDVCDAFVENDLLMHAVFSAAAGRFPYESLPFLRLCRLLASTQAYDEHGTHYITRRLRSMDTYTQLAVGRFADYQTVREDENLNLVALESNTLMIEWNKSSTSRQVALNPVNLPAGTIGEVISESLPPVVRWQRHFSAFVLLGMWLDQYRIGRFDLMANSEESPTEIVAEVIGILVALLRNTVGDFRSMTRSMDRKQEQDMLLSEISSGLHHHEDITDCVFDIMEQQLQSLRRKPSNTFDTGILVACIEFMTVLLQVKPDKFLALFSRTTMLDSFGSDSFLLTIVTGVEVANRRFPLLVSCCDLFKEMIKAALPISSVTPPSTRKRVYSKIAPQAMKLQASLLQSLTQSLFVVYERLPAWTFSSDAQLSHVIATLSNSFTKIADYAHGFGETSKHGTPFVPACRFLETQLRRELNDISGLTAPLQYVLKIMEYGNVEWASLNIEAKRPLVLPQILLAHKFMRLGRVQSAPVSNLELQFFYSLPVLVRILSDDTCMLSPICDFIREILEAVDGVKPVSLLGHLGSVSTFHFVEVLKHGQLVSPLNNAVDVWRLSASLVSQSQRWVALLLLTGSPPDMKRTTKEHVSEPKRLEPRGQSLVQTAVNRLVKLNELQPVLAVAILEFVIQAQQNWSWIDSTLKLRKALLPVLVSYTRDTFIDPSAVLKITYKNKITALVADLATTQLHYAKATQEKDTVKVLMSLLFLFAEDSACIQVGGYNSSLHANLKRNFADKYPELDITDFKRTKLIDTGRDGENFYDLTYLREVIYPSHHEHDIRNKHDHPFISEFQRANLNISLVESELILFRSVKHFCVQHCGYFVQDSQRENLVKPLDLFPGKAIYNALTTMIRNCLSSNTRAYPALEIFETLFQSRADLANALLQQLVNANAKGFDLKDTLSIAWECARFRNTSYEQAMVNDDLTYWRTTLTTVFLALQFHCGGKWSPLVYNHEVSDMLRHELTNVTPIVLEILDVVVGQGFRTVASVIQQAEGRAPRVSSQSTVSIRDLVLNLSLLNTILRLTRAPEFTSEASDLLKSSDVVESCLLLYSWSHALRENGYDNDPVYAALSLQYLGSLSSLPPLAEHMGIEGVLSRLLSAQITQKLQSVPHGVGHLDARPNCRYLYGLWISGMLPICLNLLNSIGAPVAAEVAVFLNQFPQQLIRASHAFVSTHQTRDQAHRPITLSCAREASMLALLSYILESYREAGASVAVDPSMLVHLAGYDEHKKALTEDISDFDNTGIVDKVAVTTDEEGEWSKTKDGTYSKLEARVLQHLKNAVVCLKGQNAESDDS